MHSKAKRAFLKDLFIAPLERPIGFAGGQPGWDHNASTFEALGVVEIWRGDGRTVATLTASGEEYARRELAAVPEVRGVGRPRIKVAKFEDMTPENQAILRARWTRDDQERDRKSDDVGAPPYTHPASRDEKP